MVHSLSSNSARIKRFDAIVTNHLKSLNSRCVRSVAAFKTLSGVGRRESAEYLNPSVSQIRYANWRRGAVSFYHNELPLACNEFLLAETVRPKLRIVSAYFKTIRGRLETVCDEQDRFMMSLMFLLEKQICGKIQKCDPERRIQIIKTYLSMHEHLNVERCPQMYSYLLDVCINPPLDKRLTIDLIKTFCYCDYYRFGVFTCISSPSGLETVILHAKAMRFDFWGLWNGDGVLALVYDFIPYFMALDLDQQYSNILIKYGFPYMTGSREFQTRCDRLQDLSVESGEIIRSSAIFSKHAFSEKRTRMMLIMDTFFIFGDFDEAPDVEKRIETLKYLNRSLPLPYITPTELYNTMQQAVVPDFEPQLRIIVSKYANADFFEDDVDILMPRRLVHLCRVTVRKVLANNFMLLDGIRQLPIPIELKHYLALEY